MSHRFDFFVALLTPLFILWGFLAVWFMVYSRELAQALIFRDGVFLGIVMWGWIITTSLVTTAEIALLLA